MPANRSRSTATIAGASQMPPTWGGSNIPAKPGFPSSASTITRPASTRPRSGGFLQTDPVGYKDQVNLYAYVGDDPVDNRDPSGTTIHVEDEQTRARLAARINALTSGKYGFNK